MELPKIEKPNFTPRKGLVALGATIAAIGFGGCGWLDENKGPIVIPPDAKERVDGGNDRAFIMDDTPINRRVFDCGKNILNNGVDTENADPQYIDLGIKGKILGVCEDVDSDWPVERIPAK